MAQQLGASVETVYGDDVAYQIAEFSRLSGVTKIVLGRGETSNRILFWKPSLTERLVELTPELDIHIIPDTGTARRFASHYKKELYAPAVPLLDLLKSTLLLVLSTLVGLIFYYLGLSEANIITVYILGVMLTSIFTKSAVCSFLNSVVGVLAFNFFLRSQDFHCISTPATIWSHFGHVSGIPSYRLSGRQAEISGEALSPAGMADQAFV